MSTQKIAGYLTWAFISFLAAALFLVLGLFGGCAQQQTAGGVRMPGVPKILMHEYEAPRHQWLEVVGPTTVRAGEHVQLESILHSILMGDANGDGLVNLLDWMRLEVNWGRTGMKWEDGDFNFDGKVDMRDYMILEANFGQEK